MIEADRPQWERHRAAAHRLPVQFRITTKQGDMRWIEHTCTRVSEEGGTSLGHRGSNRDITRLKKAEEAERTQRDALARMERTASAGLLTGAIAHELNQPLTGILSNAQAGDMLIKEARCERGEMAEIIADIISDAKRAGDVIRSLRALYSQQQSDLELVDLGTVLEDTLQMLHSEFIMQQVTLTADCADPVPTVRGNRVQFQQVLLNLLMNAVQAVSGLDAGDRRLHVHTACTSAEVLVTVADVGPGIATASIDRIFEPLATWKPGGTGMGLAISYSIIEAHGGRMWAENLPQGGARVGFALPIARDADHDSEA